MNIIGNNEYRPEIADEQNGADADLIDSPQERPDAELSQLTAEAAPVLPKRDNFSSSPEIVGAYSGITRIRENVASLEIIVNQLPESSELRAELLRGISEMEKNIKELEAAVEQLEKRQEKLLREAITDQLTGLLRRDAFESVLKAQNENPEIDGKRTRTGRGAFVFIDLNHVKQYNDTLGYEATSDIIRQFTQMAQLLRPQDISARYGGDEFIIYMPDTNPAMVGKALAKRMNQLLKKNPIVVTSHGQEMQVDLTFCLGVAALTPEKMETIRNAESVDDLRKTVSALIEEASERTKIAKTADSAHESIEVAYENSSGDDEVARII